MSEIVIMGQLFNSFEDAFYKINLFSIQQRGNLRHLRTDHTCRHYCCVHPMCTFEAFVSYKSSTDQYILKRLNPDHICLGNEEKQRGLANNRKFVLPLVSYCSVATDVS